MGRSRRAHLNRELAFTDPDRVYDYWLGGTDNFEAGREEAGRLLRVYPDLRRLARENRLFLRRAVHWLTAECGIRQFLDIGSGLPGTGRTGTPAVHRV